MIKKIFIEKLLYLKYKDRAFSNKNDFKQKLSKYNIDLDNLYIKIINYQVKKYGRSLHYRYVKKGKKL